VLGFFCVICDGFFIVEVIGCVCCGCGECCVKVLGGLWSLVEVVVLFGWLFVVVG